MIEARKINLSGYVTVDQLSTTNANITNLINGNTIASRIQATRFDVASSIYIGNSENEASLYYRGNEFRNCTLKMGSIANRYVLGSLVSGSATDIDLAHSHSVTVNNDGTITLGAVASSGGSFRIADTKAYKDGVSAAVNSVTVTSVGRDSASDSYDSVGHGTTVYLKATANASFSSWSKNAEGTGSITVSGDGAFNDGRADAVSWFKNQNGYTGVNLEYKQAGSSGNNDTGRIKVSFWNASAWDWDAMYFDNVSLYPVWQDGYYSGRASMGTGDVSVNSVIVYSNGSAGVDISINGHNERRGVNAANVNDQHN